MKRVVSAVGGLFTVKYRPHTCRNLMIASSTRVTNQGTRLISITLSRTRSDSCLSVELVRTMMCPGVCVLDATTSTSVLLTCTSSHPVGYIETIVQRFALCSGGAACARARVCDRFSLRLFFTTSVFMFHATTPTKGPSTVDCEVLTGTY